MTEAGDQPIIGPGRPGQGETARKPEVGRRLLIFTHGTRRRRRPSGRRRTNEQWMGRRRGSIESGGPHRTTAMAAPARSRSTPSRVPSDSPPDDDARHADRPTTGTHQPRREVAPRGTRNRRRTSEAVDRGRPKAEVLLYSRK